MIQLRWLAKAIVKGHVTEYRERVLQYRTIQMLVNAPSSTITVVSPDWGPWIDVPTELEEVK